MDTPEPPLKKDKAAAVRRYVGGLLREARRTAIRPGGFRGLTQQEVAVEIGVPQSYISSWERGVWTPSIENLWKLSVAYQCSMDDLVGRPKKKGEEETAHQGRR